MAKPAWPVILDVVNVLRSAGIVDDPPSKLQRLLDVSSAIDAAVEDWERESNFKPFLSGADSTRNFDLDGSGYIAFGAGLLSLTTFTVNGSAWTQNQQFRLSPVNNPARGWPYTGVDLVSRAYYRPGFNTSAGAGIVSITGPWGFAAAIPADAWMAVRNRAAKHVVPQLGVLRAGGMVSWKDAEASESYNPKGAYADLMDIWDSQWTQALRNYRLDRVG